MAPTVSVEPLPASERAHLAAIEQLCAEELGGSPSPVATCRVAVRDAFAMKDALKATHYRWEPATKAWWTPLESQRTLYKLQVRAVLRSVSAPGAIVQ